jgi:hypothetical protein
MASTGMKRTVALIAPSTPFAMIPPDALLHALLVLKEKRRLLQVLLHAPILPQLFVRKEVE